MKPAFRTRAVFCVVTTVLFSLATTAQTTIIATNATWSYLDNNTRPAGWPLTHNATGWATAAAPLGYSNGVAAGSTVSFGPDANNKYITTYFNKIVNIPDADAYGSYTLNLTRDDGAIVYINGKEAVRSNMPKTAPAHGTLAASNVTDGAPETQIYSYTVNSGYFVDGNNFISIELHQSGLTSSDLSFTLEVVGNGVGVNTTYINFGESWKYLDNGTDQGTAWKASGFNDASWNNNNGDFGYGASQATVIDHGGCTPLASCGPKYITTYFRKTITITDPTIFANFVINYKRDDGIIVWINGVERHLDNLTTGATYLTNATLASDNGTTIQSATLSKTFFSAGTNVIAVELHQGNNTSSDLEFDFELVGAIAPPPPSTLLAFGSTWKYKDLGTNEGTAWYGTSFNDASWKSNSGKFGYGDAATTYVYSGCGASNYPAAESSAPGCATKYVTTYFRKSFNITGVANYSSFTLNLVRDDGYVIYVNGVEATRGNMPSGVIAYNTLASGAISGADETTPTPIDLSACLGLFQEGTNIIAVEIHQNDQNSTDLGFDLEIIGNVATVGTPVLTRQPYLQMGRQDAITIRWRTSAACFGRVEVGTSPGVFTITSNELCATTEHEVTVTGLTADTKYWYRIGTTAPLVLQETATNFFTTLPPANTTRKLRFAVFGDCGRNDNSFQSGSIAQYQRYLTDNSIDAPDAMLLLGDNAYTTGSETEYVNNFFAPFGPTLLRNHKVYTTPGNHDYNNGSEPASRTRPYYLNFTMPTNGEIGGVPSGTEAFYSFDIGDVHFLSLDSYGTEAGNTKLYDTAGPQVTWIKADLAATTKKWIIAFWHHPPYTKGSHDSDSETDLRGIRENFIRILERNGVDMILNGHSHDYERSYLLKGYYKVNPADAPLTGVNFNVATHAVSNSSGKYDGTPTSCVYTTTSGKVHHGTVYVLSGSSGADGGVISGTTDPWPHNALPFSVDGGGMVYFEIDNNRLDFKFISNIAGGGGAPIINDRFTILKDVNKTVAQTIPNGSAVNLTASWPGDYSWSPGGATTRTLNVTPPNNAVTVYTVTDGLGCIADQFTITTSGTLPVSLTSYEVKLNVNKVDVTWSTSTELNNSYYTIERSADGNSFTEIGNVAGNGNSNVARNYSFVDPAPLYGVSYYRLSQTDFDNNRKYLGTKRIVYNPGKNLDVKAISGRNSLALQINTTEEGMYTIRIHDMLGREWKNERIVLTSGNTHKEFKLGSGVYIWEVRNEQGTMVRQKVVVQ